MSIYDKEGLGFLLAYIFQLISGRKPGNEAKGIIVCIHDHTLCALQLTKFHNGAGLYLDILYKKMSSGARDICTLETS